MYVINSYAFLNSVGFAIPASAFTATSVFLSTGTLVPKY